MIDNNPIYTCYTLFDIPDKGDRTSIRNWNTIVQILSLRCQPIIIEFPTFQLTNLSNYSFGKKYKGKENVWSFSFTTELPALYADETNPLGLLLKDSNLVPMIDKKNKIFFPCCLITEGELCNIYYTVNSQI